MRNTRLAMEQNALNIKAQLLDLEFEIRNAQRDYKNKKSLISENLISAQEYEIAEDQYKYLSEKRDLMLLSYHQDSVYREIQLNQIAASLKRMENNLEIVKGQYE